MENRVMFGFGFGIGILFAPISQFKRSFVRATAERLLFSGLYTRFSSWFLNTFSVHPFDTHVFATRLCEYVTCERKEKKRCTQNRGKGFDLYVE